MLADVCGLASVTVDISLQGWEAGALLADGAAQRMVSRQRSSGRFFKCFIEGTLQLDTIHCGRLLAGVVNFGVDCITLVISSCIDLLDLRRRKIAGGDAPTQTPDEEPEHASSHEANDKESPVRSIHAVTVLREGSVASMC